MKKVKFGVLGAGPRTETLLKTYAACDMVEVTSVCDIADDLAATCAAAYENAGGKKGVKIYKDYEEMMKRRDFEALLVTVDPYKQVAFACDAMERGCHVMTEVPACNTIEDCYKLVNTVEKTGMKYQLAEQARYWNFFGQWRKMASEGKFGKILMVEGQYLHYEPTWDLFVDKRTGKRVQACDNKLDSDPNFRRSWRYDFFKHPIFYLPHTLSPLLSVTGGRIEKVACFGTRKGSYTMDGLETCDVESAVMYNSNDVIFNVRAGFTSPHPHQKDTYAHWYHIAGTEGVAEWARSEIDTPKFWSLSGGWEERNDWKCETDDAEDFIKNSLHGGVDGWPIKYFAEAVLNDTVPPMDVYKAVECAAPAIMAAKSSELGGVMLEVPDFRKKC